MGCLRGGCSLPGGFCDWGVTEQQATFRRCGAFFRATCLIHPSVCNRERILKRWFSVNLSRHSHTWVGLFLGRSFRWLSRYRVESSCVVCVVACWGVRYLMKSDEVRFVTPTLIRQVADTGCPHRSVISMASRADSLRRCLEHQLRDTSFPARRGLGRDFAAGLVGVDFFFGLPAWGDALVVRLEAFDDGLSF